MKKWYFVTYHNLVALGDLGNLSRAKLAVLDVGSTTSTNTRNLGGGVHTDENDV